MQSVERAKSPLVTWPGLIMDIPLGIGAILAHAVRNHGDREIVSRINQAQLAIAIAVLTVAPVRLANLTAIRLGTDLIKPGGPDAN